VSEIRLRIDPKGLSAARAYGVMCNGPSRANVASNYLVMAAIGG